MKPRSALLFLALSIWIPTRPILNAGELNRAPNSGTLWSADNIVAWCIVPYDAAKRGPEARAAMLTDLGIRKFAYDFRPEHIPTFDAEVAAMRRHQVEIVAWWFPQTLNETAQTILAVIERHGIQPQLWVSGGGAEVKDEAGRLARIASEMERLRSIARAAAPLRCVVGLYNHGGWFGEPENQIAIIEKLRREGISNVGIVYNFHHAHAHIDGFAARWRLIQPHVLAVNLNGMARGADQRGQKIMYLGDGDAELEMIRIIQTSGWRGLVGVLNHRTDVDAEEGLKRNLQGLRQLARQLETAKKN